MTINLRQISEKTLVILHKAIFNELTYNSELRKAADSVALRRKEGELLDILVAIDHELTP